ncbi:CYT protein, partial [Amia calva]|nr:CYT protein [Amia calva]
MARFLISFLAVAVACLFSTATSVPISTSNRGVQMAADFAIGSHNLVSKNANALKIIKIESVEYQIMPPSRAKYTMTVEVGKTVCKNVRGVNLADCALETGANAQTMTCNFVVLAVPNTDFSSYLLKDQCF